MFENILRKEEEKHLKFVYQKNTIYIENYKKLLIFDDEHILLETIDKRINIKGKNLIITRFYEKEILISGEIKDIEFR